MLVNECNVKHVNFLNLGSTVNKDKHQTQKPSFNKILLFSILCKFIAIIGSDITFKLKMCTVRTENMKFKTK